MRTNSPALWTRPDFRAITGKTWRPGGEDLTRHGLALCAFARGDLVLDVGCGAGATLVLLRGQGCRPVGLDRTVAFTDHGNGHVDCPVDIHVDITADSNMAWPVIRADAAQMPLASASFDGLVMECVLSLMSDPVAVLRECARVLKSDARFLLTDLFAKNIARVSPVAKAGRQAGSSCHERALPIAEMESMFASAGLRVKKFEDHTAHLRELAARLVWYGQASRESLCACCTGYGLWLLKKGEQA